MLGIPKKKARIAFKTGSRFAVVHDNGVVFVPKDWMKGDSDGIVYRISRSGFLTKIKDKRHDG